ncbi:MBL fold metallo-hydrolase [Liquorilactobacillus mali]|uniref:Beta-lactamase domain-containing protein n=1 Tax=Liquorilactobacillus mali KCTC 3596 = DSM 20444 TaxID=1046596 RepID=J0L0M6_9LACO|nr:MBL fold metallo-hydrolase [Liquorilactobacillus mali]EJF00927.1 beta-lactamase domain-containing protein [Liquorilactobacillus mali KCTC 3596 = DSM 20444]KRN11502.1 beta-lactamase domain-containing protein [Liquorilactobacillus mali KCTC 3596 = DSM 20444]MDC7952399.1 MBL fold metallo-hydrolase [Liquorilactobacillus mali]MDV7756746.1 MBL fold metallo-hydrolase [Liquorilactobacillus mali]QFQ74251.1 MBL fold metallo-hydrolase [Liquorilactobacillus mali]
MKVTVLGMYGGYPYAGKGTSSYLIQTNDYNLLLDCGSGALLSLEQHLNPLELDGVLLSHYHNDHIADVGVLQYYWQLNNQEIAGKELPIYGHAEDQEHFASLTWPDATVGVAYNPAEELTLKSLRITFLKTKHPVTAYAVRIEDTVTKEVLTYTADTAEIPEMIPFAHDSDLLITDTNFSAAKKGKKWHMTSTESAKLALKSGSKKLMLSHLPQKISANQLVKEAEKVVGKQVEVFSAYVGLKIIV